MNLKDRSEIQFVIGYLQGHGAGNLDYPIRILRDLLDRYPLPDRPIGTDEQLPRAALKGEET